MKKDRPPIFVVIPNWNGADDLAAAIDSVLSQRHSPLRLVIVDNGSTDASRKIIEKYQTRDERVTSIYRDKNYGFTGGVNPGIELAIGEGAEYVALLNNDAVADKQWLGNLAEYLDKHKEYGTAACTILKEDGKTIDSIADQYTTWGIPFPRGRDEPASARGTKPTDIFGASGGASLYRTAMLREVGLFDQDFFAYYEDIDISFRSQLAGWKVASVPASVVYHAIGKTSARLGGKERPAGTANAFTTKQFMKNLPYILIKDVPFGLLMRILPRFVLAYSLFLFRALFDGRAGGALKGVGWFWLRFPKKIVQRVRIQKHRKVSNEYLWSIFVHDLPPNAHKLKKLRAFWWRLSGRKAS